jgi:hypothetical protein
LGQRSIIKACGEPSGKVPILAIGTASQPLTARIFDFAITADLAAGPSY